VAALESRARGGPYLQIWPYNPTYYRYSIDAQGVLEIAILKAVGLRSSMRRRWRTKDHRTVQVSRRWPEPKQSSWRSAIARPDGTNGIDRYCRL